MDYSGSVGSVSLIQPLDSRLVTFGKHLQMCPGGERAECVVNKCLTQFVELSVHEIGIILKSDTLIFNPCLCSLVPLNIVQVELKKHRFRLQNTRDLFLLKETKGSTQKSGLEMQQQIVFTRIQISRYPDIQISGVL